MDYSVHNSNNERALLKSNGPYRLTTADNSVKGVVRPQVFEINPSITIGQVKIYGVEPPLDHAVENTDSKDTEPSSWE